MEFNILTLCYLIASVTFIIGLKMLSNPASARRGNLLAAAGMTIAILGTIFLYRDEAGLRLHNHGWIFAGIAIGSIVGTLAAKKVKMTAMPEMVSMFNGMGGACAALISAVEFDHIFKEYGMIDGAHMGDFIPFGHYLTIIAGAIIGSVSFAGSMIAWGKLSGKIKDFAFPGQHIVNLLVLLVVIVAAGFTFGYNVAHSNILFFVTIGMALVYGVLFVMPIGGADMPVVISLLNSFTGVAAACG